MFTYTIENQINLLHVNIAYYCGLISRGLRMITVKTHIPAAMCRAWEATTADSRNLRERTFRCLLRRNALKCIKRDISMSVVKQSKFDAPEI